MREIKFRLWDTVLKRMILTDGKHMNKVRLWLNGAVSIQDTWATRDVILMQFTGLLDTKGNEIFEGDILQHTWTEQHECELEEYRAKYLVIWGEPQLSWFIERIVSNELRPLSDFYCQENEIGIIGNVHQYPNLLEK